MSGILVLAEHDSGQFKGTAAELIGKATELAGALGGAVSAVVLGSGTDAASLGHFGASTVYEVAADFSRYDTGNVVAALQAALDASGASTLLAPASYLGKDAIPRLAARLGTGQASECTELNVDGGKLVGRRPVYAGKAFVSVSVNRSPGIYTVRPNSFPQPAGGGGAAEVVQLAFSIQESPLAIVERRSPESQAVDLSEADRIVSGGRSLKSKESFDSVVRPLAASIGATPGASRAAVDAGYAPHGDQVGQTGKVVNPSLYIALGISGAIQHLAGMRTSKVIVAVNKDPDAPIFEHATYGLVADLFEVAPLLQKEFEALK